MSVEVKQGERMEPVLRVLGRHKAFVEAIQSEIGQELTKDLVSNYWLLLNKIADEQANEEDRADFRATKRLLARFSDRLASYNKAMGEVRVATTS